MNPYAPPNAEPAAPQKAASGLGVFLWILLVIGVVGAIGTLVSIARGHTTFEGPLRLGAVCAMFGARLVGATALVRRRRWGGVVFATSWLPQAILNATAPREDAALTAGVSFGFLAVMTLAVGLRWKMLR